MINQEPSSIATDAAPRPTSAADVMKPAPRTCSKFSRVIEVVLIFKEEDCGMVPVVEEGRPIGVVTDRDVALALGKYDDLVDRPVSDIMTTNLISVTPDAPLAEVIELFAREAVRRLLVVDAGGQLVGVIGWKDVCGELPNRVVGRVVTSIVEEPPQK
jgi:CBS domain-containing protein